MKAKRVSNVLMIFGAILILGALGLCIYNWHESRNAEIASAESLAEVKQIVEQMEAKEEQPSEEAGEETPDKNPVPDPYLPHLPTSAEMPEVEIDGNKYIGYLSIPSLNLELPVMSDWAYPKLKIAPCRQFGATRSNDLVIAAHNYSRHFGHLKDMKAGDTIQFVDMNGEVSVYSVEIVEIIPPGAIDEVQNSEWDLVLYTCTYGGKSRVMLGARKILVSSRKQIFDSLH